MFKVVKHKFAPKLVGQPRMVEILGSEVNLPITTNATARMVKGNMSQSKAQALADKLNDKPSLNEDLTEILTYTVRPMR